MPRSGVSKFRRYTDIISFEGMLRQYATVASKPPSRLRARGKKPVGLDHFIQRQRVLALWKDIVRSTSNIPDKAARQDMRQFARSEFEQHREVTDLGHIRYLISYGKSQFQTMKGTLINSGGIFLHRRMPRARLLIRATMASTTKKSVLIVGAGPAGLVAANVFKQNEYLVSIYETEDRVGGIWRGEHGGPGDKCSPDMRTNLSRFTVAFSDFSWRSIDKESLETAANASINPPIFPKAWQVGRYLEMYAKTSGVAENVFLQRRVVNASLREDNTWKVVSEDGTGQVHSNIFDRLIVASGFFNKPARSFDPTPSRDHPHIQHSSKFRHLSELAASAGNVVVIGGGISGSEAAAQAAFQISNAKNSPSKVKPLHSDSQVYHVVNRPFYCLHRYLPQDPQTPDGEFNPSPKFLPIDLVLYNLSRRGSGEISAAITLVLPERAQQIHEFLRRSLGGDQSDVGRPELVYKEDQTQYPGYTGITDTYMEFVRSGIIVPVRGWVENVSQQADGELLDISLQQYEPWYYTSDKEAISKSTINDAVGIIEATGYKADIDWLDSRVRDLLNDEDAAPNVRIPYALSRGSILASRVPTIGFVGFYEGPYWGVMELQAQFLAQTWAQLETTQPMGLPDRGIYKNDAAKLMQGAMKEKSLQIPQFWMVDYVGLMEEFARETNMTRDDSAFKGPTDPAFPSRYQGTNAGSEAKDVVKEVADIIKASNEDARFVAAAVFTSMQGIWNLTRKIESRTNTPGGTFTGTAHFHPRDSTSPAYYTAEYLYVEEGTFTMDTGLSFPATRRYAYRYNEQTDKITAWFVHEDNASVSTLFNTWKFFAPEDKARGWMAKGHHWCDPDTYRNTCEFRFRGAKIDTFMIRYQVQGPKKNYSHESWYERPKANGNGSRLA
ncbi:FMO1 Flavin-containing monooxygenase [Pyrenophora seminiperda CCB06]|uniref:FMO1 Flavin-containing monooxygenase n=1 Tax=Pyrenophora seminiperda CCB06 TaxID=1302712 RepID=A0A3M7MHI0_9PLEO|nr:FMO1 Flavin-containing monooxygenase [Pyrenophora seminiperda CCB06]